jgi:hypothetical protein
MVVDRLDPLRPFGMPRTRIVLEIDWVPEIGGGRRLMCVERV